MQKTNDLLVLTNMMNGVIPRFFIVEKAEPPRLCAQPCY